MSVHGVKITSPRPYFELTMESSPQIKITDLRLKLPTGKILNNKFFIKLYIIFLQNRTVGFIYENIFKDGFLN